MIFRLTTAWRLRIIMPLHLGAWCNGNTWVSKTFVEGSNPSAPAIKETSFVYQGKRGFFLHLGQKSGKQL